MVAIPTKTVTNWGTEQPTFAEGIKIPGELSSAAIYIDSNVLVGRVLIESKDASASSEIDFTSGIDSGFDRYEIDINNIVPATDGTHLHLRVSVSSSFKSGASDYSWRTVANGTAVTDSSDAQIALTGNAAGQNMGNVSGECGEFRVAFCKPSGTSLFIPIKSSGAYIGDGAEGITVTGCGYYTTIGAIDGIRFLMSSGNITSGTFKLYGIR